MAKQKQKTAQPTLLDLDPVRTLDDETEQELRDELAPKKKARKRKSPDRGQLVVRQPLTAEQEAAVEEYDRNTLKARRGTTNILAAIVAAANSSHPDRLAALLDARDRLIREEAKVSFVQAYIEMQNELPFINRDGKIEITPKETARSQKKQVTPYATLNEIMRVTRPILYKHKFALMTTSEPAGDAGGVVVRGMLSHATETAYGKFVHTEHCIIRAPLDTGGSKNNVQGVGSSLTYLRRYSAIQLLGLITYAKEDADTDGNIAQEVKTINMEQAQQLAAKIKECGVLLADFCQRYKIAHPAELPIDQFSMALKACEAYAAKKAGQA